MWESGGNSRILCEFPCGNPMGILWEFQRGNPIGDLIRYPFDFECLHNDAINIYTFLCNYNINHSPPAPGRVSVGMEIPILSAYGW